MNIILLISVDFIVSFFLDNLITGSVAFLIMAGLSFTGIFASLAASLTDRFNLLTLNFWIFLFLFMTSMLIIKTSQNRSYDSLLTEASNIV